MARDPLAVKKDIAAGGGQTPGQHIEARGFARAIGAYQAMNASVFNRQTQIIENGDFISLYRYIVKSQMYRPAVATAALYEGRPQAGVFGATA